ncbi:hypothetical protein ACFLYQ_07650 [Chloroflexota bacterium]
MAKAMLMDTNLCLDCNACTVECKRNNDVPTGRDIFWTKMKEQISSSMPVITAPTPPVRKLAR